MINNYEYKRFKFSTHKVLIDYLNTSNWEFVAYIDNLAIEVILRREQS